MIAITNGNFASTTGMSNTGGGWYGGTPPGWTLFSTGSYVVNNGVLNGDPIGYASQSLGTIVFGAEKVTLSFTYADNWNGGYYSSNQDMLTVELIDSTTGITLATKTVKNIAAYKTFTTDSLSCVGTIGHTITVKLTPLLGTGVNTGRAVAMDNITVTSTKGISGLGFFAV